MKKENATLSLAKGLSAFNNSFESGYEFKIPMKPYPCPRPRASVIRVGKKIRVHIYMPTEYMEFKSSLAFLIKASKVPDKDYSRLDCCFYLPYPKSTPKKNLIDGALHRKRPDKDNYEKTLMDAMQMSGVIKEDGQIACGEIKKIYTTKSEGWIEFTLS
jgi:Holliday junction resolvase RusA-like endonuclease